MRGFHGVYTFLRLEFLAGSEREISRSRLHKTESELIPQMSWKAVKRIAGIEEGLLLCFELI